MDILRKYFNAGKEWGERAIQHISDTEAFEISKSNIGGQLACTVCFKILPVSEMYSVDACSESCQEKINAAQQLHEG